MKKNFYLTGLLFSCFLLCNMAASAFTPIITTNPSNTTVCSGIVASFIVNATDTPSTRTMHFQWQVSTDGGTTWSAITSGSVYSKLTKDTLKIVANSSLAGYNYRSIVSDSATSGSDTSTAGMLSVDTANAGVISGPVSICAGTMISLSDAVSGGVWSSLHADATVTGSGIVTGVTAGMDTIKYTVTNTCGAIVAMSGLTINPVPAAGVVTGSSAVCQGSTITLADTVAGGIWSSVSPGVATVDTTGLVTAVSQGFDTVEYTTTNGLCNSVAWLLVRVDTFVTSLPITGPTVTCIGHTIDLMNANVFGTWTWTASNASASVSPSGTVTGSAAGLDTITYVFTNTCNSVTSTDTVHIDAILDHGVISGPTGVCAGSDISLTETVSGGSWFSSNSSIAVVDGSGDVTGVAQGTAVISYYLSNGCGASIATHTVNVLAMAAAITGPDSVGTSGTAHTITLHDATTGGTWSSSSVSIATVGSATGIVTGVANGTATITYSVTNLCGTSYATLMVYVGHAPGAGSISGIDSVCTGSSITLTDTVVGTGGGVWSSSRDTIATVSSTGVVTGVGYGSVNITYTVHNGFGSTPAVKQIFVNESPTVVVVGPNIVSLSGNYFIEGIPNGGVWSASNAVVGEFISTTTGGVDTSLGSFFIYNYGKDTLYYTVHNTCGNGRGDYIIDLLRNTTGTSIITSDAPVLNVYPNPNQGAFTMNLSSDADEQVYVVISNINGQSVKELTGVTNKSFDIRLDVPAGVYFLTAITNSGKYSAKITVTK